MSRIKVRQHVNPLSSKYQQPLTPQIGRIFTKISIDRFIWILVVLGVDFYSNWHNMTRIGTIWGLKFANL